MEGKPIKKFDNEEIHYSIEDFIKQFNNFHLIFIKKSTIEYYPEAKEFLVKNYLKKFDEIEKEFKEGNSSVVVEKNKEKLFFLYNILRNEGGFSNRDIRLIYW